MQPTGTQTVDLLPERSSGDGSWIRAETEEHLFSPASSELVPGNEKPGGSDIGDADSETTEEDRQRAEHVRQRRGE